MPIEGDVGGEEVDLSKSSAGLLLAILPSPSSTETGPLLSIQLARSSGPKMETIRDELVLLHVSLVEDEFEWCSTMSASQVEAWEVSDSIQYILIPLTPSQQAALSDAANIVQLPPPDFTLLLDTGVALHVQYHAESARAPTCTIQAPSLPREYAAELIAEVVLGESLFHLEGTSFPFLPPSPLTQEEYR